ncbi:MAG: DUF3160 domain-containing protein [Deltaproteobacteria bacterium]|nr:DUF3160 domain-containing protein [Deltaproteobacteria bacterium]
MRTLSLFAVGIALGCVEARMPPSAAAPAPVMAAPSSRGSAPARPDAGRPENEVFEQYVAKHADMSLDRLLASLSRRPESVELGFDPTTARYWPEAASSLQLTEEEKAVFRRRGFVASDHGAAKRFSRRGHSGDEPEGYSMAGMYYAIFVRDLPVLVTTDSILHALHRTYSGIMEMIEQRALSGLLEDVLAAAHGELGKRTPTTRDPALLRSLRDVDVYLTVARNLLKADPGTPGPLRIPSMTGEDQETSALLRKIAVQQLSRDETLWGGRRPAIDWSQFRPRGHYTKTPGLQQYFRAMMWLGRADLGWVLSPPDRQSGLQVDVDRERLDAAVLASLLRDSGGVGHLESIRAFLSFMIGPSDELTVPDTLTLLERCGVRTLADLASPEGRKRFAALVSSSRAGAQRIHSQALLSDSASSRPVEIPAQLQMFGQRFVLDSFVLSHVVYDSIVFRGEKQKRFMPSGLDVMAALGNDEAVALLESELKAFHYEPNLLASREVVESYDVGRWSQSLYGGWLDSLRLLDDLPAAEKRFPRAMQSRAWQHKQLQTQLGSWAELRHDTMLYAKQSYGRIACSYPAGYVEPYPAFFARIKEVASRASALFRKPDWAQTGPDRERGHLRAMSTLFVGVFDRLAQVAGQLEALADKELRGEPFDAKDEAFFKQLIAVPTLGCGAPEYSGWYPSLFFDSDPAAYRPVIADVHTDPHNDLVLEAGVGGASFLVVAVDNGDDRAVYVGPTYSYYEFKVRSAERMTDELWEKALDKQPPVRPAWVSSFQTAPHTRELPFMWAPHGRKPVPMNR